jgi:hypothetical protein
MISARAARGDDKGEGLRREKGGKFFIAKFGRYVSI